MLEAANRIVRPTFRFSGGALTFARWRFIRHRPLQPVVRRRGNVSVIERPHSLLIEKLPRCCTIEMPDPRSDES